MDVVNGRTVSANYIVDNVNESSVEIICDEGFVPNSNFINSNGQLMASAKEMEGLIFRVTI